MPSKLKMTGIRLIEEQNFGTIKIENQGKTINPKNNIETLINSGNVIVGDNSTINM